MLAQSLAIADAWPRAPGAPETFTVVRNCLIIHLLDLPPKTPAAEVIALRVGRIHTLSKVVKIALDAMGGDSAPASVVDGADIAKQNLAY